MLQLKEKNRLLFFGVFSLLAGVFLSWWYLFYTEKVPEVDFEAGGTVTITDENPSIIFAIAPVISPERNMEDYQELAGYIAKELTKPVKIIQRKTYHEINELIRIGKVNLALICTGAYLDAKNNELPLEVISVPVYNGAKSYHSLIVVRSDSPVKSMLELQGKSFAFSDPLSLTGYFYPLYYYITKGIIPDKFFSTSIFTYSHEGSINLVLDKIADAAAVNEMLYAFELKHYPDLENKIRIIHRSLPLGITPVVMSASSDSVLKNQVQRVLAEMKYNHAGRQLLKKLGIENFESPTASVYNSADSIYTAACNFLKGRNKPFFR